MSYELLLGDAVTVMKGLRSESVQTCVTSPPYYGLRDYGMDGQIGLEETPDAYVAKLVEVFREVRRVLRDDGTLWLNIGDSYNGSGGEHKDGGGQSGIGVKDRGRVGIAPGRNVSGLKPKDLIGIPWMVAFALRADGWWLRSEIIWAKRAPMPESCRDRPTKAHEQVFLLSKQANYYYDAESIKEPGSTDSHGGGRISADRYAQSVHGANSHKGVGAAAGESGRNKRSVWTLGPESYAGAHFAVMPTKLVEPCILAGTSAYGCCAACGAPWERVREKTGEQYTTQRGRNDNAAAHQAAGHLGRQHLKEKMMIHIWEDVGWAPTCTCNAAVVPCVVLDPFNGAATTGIVAMKHHRNYIGIDLNADYLKLSEERLGRVQPMLLSVTP